MIDIKDIITQNPAITKINIDYLNWYIIYCYEFNSPDMNRKISENHHILPRKLFPEYTNLNINSWNASRLPTQSHLIAHYLLMRAIKNISTIAAFNLMRRALYKAETILDLATLYEQHRYEISLLGGATKGKHLSAAHKEKLSKIVSGTNLVYSPDNPSLIFRVSITDERYLRGDLVHSATGRTHSQDTKNKMSDNGIKNKICIHENSNIQNMKFIKSDVDIPDGYSIGNPMQVILGKESLTNAAHWHNPITKENFRIKPGDSIPDGAIKGRAYIENNPFRGNIICKNFKTGEIFQNKTALYPIFCGTPSTNKAFIFEGKITYSVNSLVREFPNQLTKSIISKILYDDKNAKIYHYKMSKQIREYLKNFTTYCEIPIKIITIEESLELITPDNWLQ